MNAQKLTTSIRLDADLIDRLDRLAESMSDRAGGAPVNRSSAARVALERGIDALESEFRLSKKKRT
jgi:predicted transcriptional regulator